MRCFILQRLPFVLRLRSTIKNISGSRENHTAGKCSSTNAHPTALIRSIVHKRLPSKAHTKDIPMPNGNACKDSRKALFKVIPCLTGLFVSIK